MGTGTLVSWRGPGPTVRVSVLLPQLCQLIIRVPSLTSEPHFLCYQVAKIVFSVLLYQALWVLSVVLEDHCYHNHCLASQTKLGKGRAFHFKTNLKCWYERRFLSKVYQQTGVCTFSRENRSIMCTSEFKPCLHECRVLGKGPWAHL